MLLVIQSSLRDFLLYVCDFSSIVRIVSVAVNRKHELISTQRVISCVESKLPQPTRSKAERKNPQIFCAASHFTVRVDVEYWSKGPEMDRTRHSASLSREYALTANSN